MAKKKSNKLLYILISVAVLLVIFAVVGKKAGWIGKQKEIEVDLGKVEKKTIVEKVSASGMVQPVTEVRLSPDVSGEIIELWIEEGDSVYMGQPLVKLRPDNYLSIVESAEANLNQQKANLADAKARLARARATFERSRYDFDRSKQLIDEKVISEADYQLAEANFKVAKNDLVSAEQNVVAAGFIVKSSQAALKDTQENLRKTSIEAPMNGIVSKLDVELGERVVGSTMMTGTEMMRIADLNIMEVRVDVNENDIIRVSDGDTAIIDVDSYAYMDKKFEGVVTSIANTANDKPTPDAVTEFEVKIRILAESYTDLQEEGKKYPFRPGMTASVDIITEIKNDVIAVPLSAVTTRSPVKEENGSNKEGSGNDENSGESSNSNSESENSQSDNRNSNNKGGLDIEEDVEVVFINENGTAKKVEVKTGISDYDNIEILEGVEEGQEVVTGPFVVVSKRLEGGELIKVPEEKDEKERTEEDNE
jgi:HlyD family secretion protein